MLTLLLSARRVDLCARKMVILSEGKHIVRLKVGYHCILRQVIIWLSTIWVDIWWTLHTCRVPFLYQFRLWENGNEIDVLVVTYFLRCECYVSIDLTRPGEVIQT